MTTLVPPTTDSLAIAIAELDKRFNTRMDQGERRLDERFAAQQTSVDRAMAEHRASAVLAAEALARWQASANSQITLFGLRVDSVYTRLVTTIMILSISFFSLSTFSFFHGLLTGH